MNIGDIISEVDEVWAPNNVTTARKCRWLTQDQWQVLRKVNLPNTTDIISTVAGVAAYPLPTDCQPDQLRHVVLVNLDDTEVEYHFRSRANDAGGRWYNILPGNLLVLSEAPVETDASLVLFYVPRPAGFTESDLLVVPVIPEDYQEYLVKKLASRCAKANAAAGGGDRDTILANNYETEAAEILAAMMREFAPDPGVGFRMEVRW